MGPGAKVIPVPSDYRTNCGAVRKARALQHAVEVRRLEGSRGTQGEWIFNKDGESVVTPQTALSLLAFVRGRSGLIAEVPIVYLMKLDRASKLTTLAESVRPFLCYRCV